MKRTKASKKPMRIVIYVSGGVVQDVLADTAGLQMMVVDYDSEESGEEYRACRAFAEIPVNRVYIEKTIHGTED